MRARAIALLAAVAVVGACTTGDESGEAPSPADSPPGATPTAAAQSPTASPTPAPSPTVSPTRTPSPTPTPVEYDVANVQATIERLAGQIGPREGTSDAFHQAAAEIGDMLAGYGYAITEVDVPVPAGESWGVDVPEGTSMNVIADPPGFDPTQPHVVIGAHLDSVPQSPGAEDNASGVASMVELARVAANDPPTLPVRFIAFGAEEPRGEGDDWHHFGSQQYVAALSDTQADAVMAMVSLDRVGVRGDALPICTGGTGTVEVRDAVVNAAESADVPPAPCADDRASDHWSFEKADIPSARVGSIPFGGYHSEDDVPSVIDERQLGWVGSTMVAWLASFG